MFKLVGIMRFALVTGCVLLLSMGCLGSNSTKVKRSPQGVPTLVSVSTEDCTGFCDLACNNQCFEGDDCFKEECECGCDSFCGGKPDAPNMILHYSFNDIDKATVSKVKDMSNYGNDGKPSTGTKILKTNDMKPCGNFASLFDSTICIHGPSIQSKPKHGITIMLWTMVRNLKGAHSFFSVYPSTVGLIATQNKGLYHLELNDNQIRFMHRGKPSLACQACAQPTCAACGSNIMFSVHAKSIHKETWTHVAASYDSKRTQAKVFINGELANFTSAEGGCLNTDWNDVCIGGNKDFRPLHGEVDEFKIFNYAMTEPKIKLEMTKGCPAATVASPARGVSDDHETDSGSSKTHKEEDFIELDSATI